jgi:hypothetical protein
VKQWNEEFEKERRRVLLMKNNVGGVGKGYEDAVGATAIGAPGDPIWKEEVMRVLMTRSDHSARCVRT